MSLVTIRPLFVVLSDPTVGLAGGLIGYGIGHIKGAMASWRLEFLIVGAVCAAWGVVIALTLANSPLTSRWFNKEEKLMMLARMRRNQTGIESKRIRWGQVREAVLDYKTVSVELQVIRWKRPNLTCPF